MKFGNNKDYQEISRLGFHVVKGQLVIHEPGVYGANYGVCNKHLSDNLPIGSIVYHLLVDTNKKIAYFYLDEKTLIPDFIEANNPQIYGVEL